MYRSLVTGRPNLSPDHTLNQYDSVICLFCVLLSVLRNQPDRVTHAKINVHCWLEALNTVDVAMRRITQRCLPNSRNLHLIHMAPWASTRHTFHVSKSHQSLQKQCIRTSRGSGASSTTACCFLTQNIYIFWIQKQILNSQLDVTKHFRF